MNKKEEFKLHIIKCVIAKKLTIKEASKRLKLSERQVKRLKRRVKENGESSMLHRNCGRQPKITLSSEIKQKIIKIKSMSEYSEVNFLHFRELLEKKHKIKISYFALRKLLLENDFKSPKTHRKSTKVKHPRRQRKESFGEMLQCDASTHQWFQNDSRYYTIHGAIDDATSIVTGLYMCENECTEGYFGIIRQTLKNYGVPKSLYLDGSSIFFSSKEPTIEEQLDGKMVNETGFGKIMGSLGVHMIHAYSSQAKGRIERLWGTLQGRLLTEFAIKGIKTIEEANFFFKVFLKEFNKKFSVKSSKSESSFLPLTKDTDLDILFSVKLNRIVDNSGCFSLDNTLFQCDIKGLLPRTKVDILISKKLGVKVFFKGKLFTPTPILKQAKQQINGSSISAIIDDFVYRHCLKNERIS